MPLFDLEQAILAEGRRLRAVSEEDALKVRRSNLLKEIEAIEAELGKFAALNPEPAPAAEPEQAKAPAKPAAKKAPAKS